MGRLRKFCSLSRPEKLGLSEAAILLLLSGLGLRTISFRHFDRFLRACWGDRPWQTTNRDGDIALVELSVERAARLLPWQCRCLSRSITTYLMLRRRGVSAALYAGARLAEDSSLLAHAWVETGRGAIARDTDTRLYATLLRIGQEQGGTSIGRGLVCDPSESPGNAATTLRQR